MKTFILPLIVLVVVAVLEFVVEYGLGHLSLDGRTERIVASVFAGIFAAGVVFYMRMSKK